MFCVKQYPTIAFLHNTLYETKAHQVLDNQYTQLYLKSLIVALLLMDMNPKKNINTKSL